MKRFEGILWLIRLIYSIGTIEGPKISVVRFRSVDYYGCSVAMTYIIYGVSDNSQIKP